MKPLIPFLLLMVCFCLLHCSETPSNSSQSLNKPTKPNTPKSFSTSSRQTVQNNPDSQSESASNISPKYLTEQYFRDRISTIITQKLPKNRFFVSRQSEFHGQLDILKPRIFPFNYTFDNEETLTIVITEFTYTCQDGTYGGRKTDKAWLRVNLNKDFELDHARYSSEGPNAKKWEYL